MKIRLLIPVCLIAGTRVSAQSMRDLADSIRREYNIPELAFAVLSSDSTFEMQVIGTPKINSGRVANITDRFRIGSNTKAVTGVIAALLVRNHKISWDTRFFDLFPGLEAKSRPAYRKLTLLNLLTFRTRLFPYTYTDRVPLKDQFTGSEGYQRYLFAEWFLQQKPVAGKGDLHFSNLGYVAAELMIEKASGRPYKELLEVLGELYAIDFGFGAPNSADTLQPWGHDAKLVPEPPGENYKLEWLLAAGNINLSLPDYIKFIRIQLYGLHGKSVLLSQEQFEFLHTGLPQFAVGWFWEKDAHGHTVSHNTGNPGTFLSKVYVFKELDRAYILLANAQTAQTEEGLDVLYNRLKQTYGD